MFAVQAICISGSAYLLAETDSEKRAFRELDRIEKLAAKREHLSRPAMGGELTTEKVETLRSLDGATVFATHIEALRVVDLTG